MKVSTKKIKTLSGKEIVVKSNQFTDEELSKMPKKHKKLILFFRHLTEESIKMS